MNSAANLEGLSAQIETLNTTTTVGRVARVEAGIIEIDRLSEGVRIGDRMRIARAQAQPLLGEIVQLHEKAAVLLPESGAEGIALGDRATLARPIHVAPSEEWLGRLLDADGKPMDGLPLQSGPTPIKLRNAPPSAAARRPLGHRLSTGVAATNTLLPIVKGQRMGLFAGSGVGKSSLLGALARHLEADVVVIALIGERGREVRHFVDEIIGPEKMARTVVVAATSDQSSLKRRRCAWTAMAIAEHFRDEGKSVLFLADSITRFAEAHREVAVAAGEAPVLRGYPPSTASMIMSLCERAGPGAEGQGDITAVFSVLVAGSDMEEPIADILRGVLDGHIVLDRTIAERGRFPAIDVLQSVSRSLPDAASDDENAVLKDTRKLLGLYERNSVMIRAGLYNQGADPELDRAVAAWADIDQFLAQTNAPDCTQSFQQLRLILRRAKSSVPPKRTPAQPDG